jgi:Integrase core domain
MRGLSLPSGVAPIAQLAEAADLKSAQCRFESDWGHSVLPQVTRSFVTLHPGENGCVESVNSRTRDECLNISSFCSLAHAAQVVISDWKHDYNTAADTRPIFTMCIGMRPVG